MHPRDPAGAGQALPVDLRDLEARLPACRTRAALQRHADLLARHAASARGLADLSAAEPSLVLARLHLRLWPFLPAQQLPRWRERDLPVPVQIAWLRTEILTTPGALRDEPPGEALL